jgi:hypothetical protein
VDGIRFDSTSFPLNMPRCGEHRGQCADLYQTGPWRHAAADGVEDEQNGIVSAPARFFAITPGAIATPATTIVPLRDRSGPGRRRTAR